MSGAPPNQRTPPRILPRTAEPCRRAEGAPSRTRPRHASRRSPPAPRRAALLPTTAAAADRLSPPSARLGRATRRRKCRSAVLGEAERQLPRSPPARGASRARELRGARERPPRRARREARRRRRRRRVPSVSQPREARRGARGEAGRGAARARGGAVGLKTTRSAQQERSAARSRIAATARGCRRAARALFSRALGWSSSARARARRRGIGDVGRARGGVCEPDRGAACSRAAKQGPIHVSRSPAADV